MLSVAVAAIGLLGPSSHPALARPVVRWSGGTRASAHMSWWGKKEDDVCVEEQCPTDNAPSSRDIAENRWPTMFSVEDGSSYSEESRKYRRTVYMHDEWIKHRSSQRFFSNMKTIFQSGVGVALRDELTVITGTAVFAVLINCLLVSYQDLSGVVHPGPLAQYWTEGPWSLPSQPFGIAMPALSLLLVFRTNTGYARWNEARTLWGGVVNTCRNVARQSNTFYPNDARGDVMRGRMVANTVAYVKALRNFLRGPADDETYRRELEDLANAGYISYNQVDSTMAAKNRPMFCLQAMSANLREVGLRDMDRSRVDTSIAGLVDLTGACERIFKSPVALVYTRHTARFLTAFLLLLPFGLWDTAGKYWNHWLTVPETALLAFFLLGIEEIGIQIEEPFSILPLEALCDGAIEATMNEMVTAYDRDDYEVQRGLPDLEPQPAMVPDEEPSTRDSAPVAVAVPAPRVETAEEIVARVNSMMAANSNDQYGV